MAGISSNIGLISGIPIKETVDRLMQISARPRDLLMARTKSLQEQQVAVNSLTALVIAIQLAAKNLGKTSLFDDRSVTSSQPNLLTATKKGAPTVGLYRLTPVRLAQADQWVSQPFASTTAAVGTGELSVSVGGFMDTTLPLDQLNGGTGVQLGKIRITDRSGTSEIIDLQYARTVDDVLEAINGASSVRVRATTVGDAIQLEDLSGQTASNLRVENYGVTKTADSLGLSSINVAASTATGDDIVQLGSLLKLSALNDGNGIALRNGVPELKISFRDGSSPLTIDFGDFSRGERYARGTTTPANGDNARLTFQAKTLGAAYDGVRVRFIDSGSVTRGNETVTYDADKKLLTFDIDAGATTAADVVAALAGDPTASALFSATAGGDGSGLVALTDGATLSGGAAVAAPAQPTIADLLRVLNEADPNRLEARIAADGDRLELLDKTTGAGTFRIESISGGSTAESLGIAASSSTGTITGRRLLGGLRSTLLSSLRGGRGVGQLGQIRITDRTGTQTIINLSSAETLDDVLQTINSSGANVRASINRFRNGLELRDTSGGSGSFVIENADATNTAALLGIEAHVSTDQVEGRPLNRQTVSRQTLLATYRYGQPVRSGSFTITDTRGKTAAVNLALLNPRTVGDIIDAINGLGLGITARINDTGDGILLVDTAGGTGTITVRDVGASTAAADLRIAGQSRQLDIGGTPTQAIDGTLALRMVIDGADTLQDVLRQINESAGPVKAALVQEGGPVPYRLLLTSTQSGAAGQLLIDDRQGLLAPVRSSLGQDALLAVGQGTNPLLLSSNSNTFDNAVEGLSVTISGTSTEPVLVTVDRSTKSLTTNVKLLVDKYNETIKKLREFTKFDPDTNTTGILFGTTEALRVDTSLARFASSTIAGAGEIRSLAEIGITLNDDGTLSYDESKLVAKYNEDADAVKQFFTTPQFGVAARLDALIERLAGAGNSLLINRNLALQRRIELNNSRVEAMNKRLDRERQTLLAQFFRLENAVARMQSTLSALNNLQIVPPLVSRNT